MAVPEFVSVSINTRLETVWPDSLIPLGQNFALTEASYTMVRILQTFKRIEPRDPTPWREFQTLTLAVGNGVKVGMYEQ